MGLMGGIGSLPLSGSAQSAGEAGKTRIYLLETFYLKNGTQPGRIHEYLGKAALPALSKVHSGPKIVLEGLVVPHTPQVMLILGFQSILMGLIAELLVRTYHESQDKRTYTVRKTVNLTRPPDA